MGKKKTLDQSVISLPRLFEGSCVFFFQTLSQMQNSRFEATGPSLSWISSSFHIFRLKSNSSICSFSSFYLFTFSLSFFCFSYQQLLKKKSRQKSSNSSFFNRCCTNKLCTVQTTVCIHIFNCHLIFFLKN